MKPCLLILNGHPGVGKYTIAKAIAAILGEQSTLIHNHQLIDPALSICHGRNSRYYEFRRRLRSVAYDALINDPNAERVIILTGWFAQHDSDVAAFQEQLRIARQRSIPVFLVNLTCQVIGEHHSRIASQARMTGGTSKCTDPAEVEQLIIDSGQKLLTPADIEHDLDDIWLAFCVPDTSDMSPQESAEMLLHWIHMESES
jgi:hypothetical protein